MPAMAMTSTVKNSAILIAVVAAGVAALLLLNRGEPPVKGPPLTMAELEAILAQPVPELPKPGKPGGPPPAPLTAPALAQHQAALDGDVRLLIHLRQEFGDRPLGSGWRAFPEGLRDIYGTLRMEEIARTDGFTVGLAGVERGLGDIEPDEAAAAYERLGANDAAELMRKLDTIVQRDGAAWRAAVNPGDGPAPAMPDHREFDRLSAAFAQQLPAIRTARLTWLRAHSAEVLKGR